MRIRLYLKTWSRFSDGYSATYQMCNRPEAATAQDARFSLQYCLAAQLVLGAVRLEAFKQDALMDLRIRQLMSRITVSESADLAAAYPSRRMARLEVRARRSPDRPVSKTARETLKIL